MDKVLTYNLAIAYDRGILIEQVNAAIKDGAQPLGGISVSYMYQEFGHGEHPICIFAQAVVWTEPQ